jgi:hypothetical protein
MNFTSFSLPLCPHSQKAARNEQKAKKNLFVTLFNAIKFTLELLQATAVSTADPFIPLLIRHCTKCKCKIDGDKNSRVEICCFGRGREGKGFDCKTLSTPNYACTNGNINSTIFFLFLFSGEPKFFLYDAFPRTSGIYSIVRNSI